MITFDLEKFENNDIELLSKKEIKDSAKKLKDINDSVKAESVIDKFLEENTTINIAHIIHHLKSKLLSTTVCAQNLGISPRAFLRLRKKYNIFPIYTINNREINVYNIKKFSNGAKISKYAIKNFYTINQLKLIPEFEITATQIRAGRGLKNINGKDVPWKWTCRGVLPSGKLHARVDHIKKYGLYIRYDIDTNKYFIKDNKKIIFKTEMFLTKKEVDNLNIKLAKLNLFK